ncbi:MAG: TRAP transporter small permease, partial [Comamonas sp.]
MPAADDFAAWSMAATVFLSLPYTLRQGAHIRVTLALQVLPPRAKQLCEVLSTVAALVLVGWAAKHCTLFVHESFVGNELSQGMVILPMWVPQLSMPI